VEIVGIDPSTGNLRVNTVFEYDPIRDLFIYKGRSAVYAEIAERRGWSREQLEQEIATRKRILGAMQSQGIIDYIRVSRVFQAYSIDPGRVTANLGNLAGILE
jgi:flagellar protein FlaI